MASEQAHNPISSSLVWYDPNIKYPEDNARTLTVKEFLKRIFSKNTKVKEEKIDEPEELVASGFTIAPKQYTSIYKKK